MMTIQDSLLHLSVGCEGLCTTLPFFFAPRSAKTILMFHKIQTWASILIGNAISAGDAHTRHRGYPEQPSILFMILANETKPQAESK